MCSYNLDGSVIDRSRRSRSRGQEKTRVEVVGLGEEGLQSNNFLPMESSSSRTVAVVLINGVALQPKYSCQHTISVIQTNRPQTP